MSRIIAEDWLETYWRLSQCAVGALQESATCLMALRPAVAALVKAGAHYAAGAVWRTCYGPYTPHRCLAATRVKRIYVICRSPTGVLAGEAASKQETVVLPLDAEGCHPRQGILVLAKTAVNGPAKCRRKYSS